MQTETDWMMGFWIPTSGFLVFVNIALLIIGLVKKKVSGGNTVFAILFALGAPIIGAIWGLSVETDNGLESIAMYIVGMVYGFIVGMWGTFIFLLILLIRKKEQSPSKKVKTRVKEDTLDEEIF